MFIKSGKKKTGEKILLKFVKAFQKIEQYKGEVTFGAWLKKIVVNTCLDALKSKKRDLCAPPAPAAPMGVLSAAALLPELRTAA